MGKINKHQKIFVLILLVSCIILFNINFVYALNFNSGDKVQVINTLSVGLKVRSTPAGTIVATKYDGAIGTIMSDSPQYVYLGGVLYHWWKIDWGAGVVGWSADGYPGGVDYLKKVTPDITVTSVNAGPNAEFKPGDYIVVSWTVKNQGNIASGSFYNRVSLSTQPYGTGTLLGNYPMNSISSDSSLSDAQVPQIPTSVSSGYYYVTVFTDAYQSISELDENNNINKADSQIHISTCTSQCSSGETRCNGNYKQNCADYNSDGCYEWGGDVDCGSSYCDSFGNNYCKNNNVYHSRTCYDKGCSSNTCFSNSYTDEQLVQTCSNGCSNGVCIVNQIPICSLSSSPRSGNAPLTVTFNLGASDSDGSISAWVLGVKQDGTNFSGTGAPPSTKSYTYTTPGSYSVVFIVSDNNGAISNPCLDTINVGSNNPPIASLNASPLSGNAPLTVGFSLSASDSDGYIANWTLDYNDGTSDSGTGAPPSTKSHVYNNNGTYRAVLMVYDNDNVNSFDIQTIVVNQSLPQATLTLYVHEGSVNGQIIPEARINGIDASGKYFDVITDFNGYATIIGAIGTWNFTASMNGYKTVSWSQIINTTGRRDAFLQKEASPISIVITSPLKITPEKSEYDVSDILNAQFTIKNKGTFPVTLDVLTVGGRDPDNVVIDFYWQRNITISPNSEYTYTGKITSLLSKEGDYHFFSTYRTQEGNWNTNIDLESGLNESDRIKDITAIPKYYLSSVPMIDRGGITIPNETFPKADGKMIPIYVPSVINDSNIVREEDNWRTIKDDIIKTYRDWPSWDEFLIGFMSGIGPADTPRESLVNSVITFINTAANTNSVLKYKVTIQQKGSENNFRAIIRQGEYPSPIDDLAGVGEQVIINPLVNIYFSNAIKETFYLEPLSFPFSYWLTGSVDSLHKNDEYLYYISVANDNRIILTPKIYSDDNIKIKKISDFNPFNQETILELKGEGYASFFSGRVNDENSKSIKKALSPFYLVSNSTIKIQEHSSGELRVYDSQGNVTGIVNGVIKEEIPFSMYDNESKIVSLFDTSDVYNYNIVGTTAGTYGLTITSTGKESADQFNAIDIPISNSMVYQYQVDWNKLSQSEGVTVKVDLNGDGTFEQTILTGDNFQINCTDECPSGQTCSYGHCILQRGLVAHYPFEGNASDATGNKNNGVVNGATLIFGKIGQAYSFDGVNDYIEVPKEKLNINGPVTVSAWIKPTGNMTGIKYYNILAKERIYSSGYGIEIYGSKNWIEFWTRNSNKSASSYWNYLNIRNLNDKWTHVVGVFDGTYNKIYINGVLVKSSPGAIPYSSGLYPLRIGYSGKPYRTDLNIDSYFSGIIDEVKIWNIALNNSEIKKEYERG